MSEQLTDQILVEKVQKGDQQALINALQEDVSYQDMVLLKASHGLHLENVLAALLDGDRG